MTKQEIFAHIDRQEPGLFDMACQIFDNPEYRGKEFFAAGLRDFGIASIVGSQTAGYGSLQQIYKLNDGSAIQLTIGKYYLANSKTSWEGIGVTPDYIISYDYTTLNFSDLSMLDTGVDVQLSKAIEVAASSVAVSAPEEDANSEETGSEG